MKKLWIPIFIILVLTMTFTVFSCKDPEPEPGTGVVNPVPPNDGEQEGDGKTPSDGSDSDKEDPSTGGGTTPVATYTVRFLYDESTKISDDITDKKVGEKINLPTVKDVERKGFSGWFTSNSNTGTPITTEKAGGVYTVDSKDAINNVITLYALYYDLANEIPVTAIKIQNENEINLSKLDIGNTVTFNITYEPENATVKPSVNWSVSDASIFDLTESNGKVTIKAKKVGSATLNAVLSTNDTIKDSVSATVIKSLLSLSVAKTTDYDSASPSFTATVRYSDNSTQDVTSSATWTSSNEDVATVSAGVVTLKAAGEATISVSYTYEGVTKSGENQIITVKSSGGTGGEIDKIYFIPSSTWNSQGSPRYAAYFFEDGNNLWVSLEGPDSNGAYVCDKPDGYTTVIFCRMNPNANVNSWDNKWNQTGDISIPEDKDTFKLKDDIWDNGTEAWLSDLTGSYGSSSGGTLSGDVTVEPLPDDDGSDEGDNSGSGSGSSSGNTGSSITDRIILHAYEYVNVYTFNVSDSKYEKIHTPMDQEGDSNWYTATLNVTSASIIFTKSASGWDSQTGDLSREAGEWWYKNGTWTDYNPDDTVVPEISKLTANKTGVISGIVEFTVSATDNLKLATATFYCDEKQIGSVNMTSTSDTQTFDWDSRYCSNGNHIIKVVVADVGGNTSEKTLSITTENENLPPVPSMTGAKVAKFGDTKTFKSTSTDPNGTISAYDWSVTGGATIEGSATSESVQIKFPKTETTCVITLVVTDNDGAESTVTKEVEVKNLTVTDFREETIYFLMTTRFYDGDPTNNQYSWDEGGDYLKKTEGDYAWRGDFAGIIEKLDYIKALGFSAIWITPVVENSSGIDYHGYHASDFSTVDPRYARKGEDPMVAYQELIDACHEKGIKVIQDIVLNHTGNFGEAGLFKMFDTRKTGVDENGHTNFVDLDPYGGYGYEALKKALAGSDYDSLPGEQQYGARINAMKEDTNDTDLIYHHAKMIDWNSENCQLGQMAGDCVDLNTENPTVYNYLIDCYNNYIEMGVDGFRIDTVKHISRLTFNKTFLPAFRETGGDSFFMFGETCARYRGRWNEGVPALSPSFYTWAETENFNWSDSSAATNSASASAHFERYKSDFNPPKNSIANHKLNGNEYHTPDYSKRSYLDQIDFPMHWAFNSVNDAYNTCLSYDDDFNDATWNVTYVDSHDYAPDGAPENQRFAGYWPDKLNLMFTFRGIPCIYYGSEIEFKKGMPIDPANTRTSLEESGRAYLGTHLEGTVTATDYGEYEATGAVAETLNHDLAQHIIRLNKIRRAVPALQKGQYSTEGCSGSIAFKRRFTDAETGVDSFVCVTINGGATFSNIPNGTYRELITGKIVSGSSITSDSIGQGNMRVYVLQNETADAYGANCKIGTDGAYLN